MIKIIQVPEKIISWNKFYSGTHWATRKKIVDHWHKQVYWECYQRLVPKFEEGVKITVKSYSKKPLDPDNVCSKIIIDGLVKAGVIGDDNPNWIKSVTTISEKSDKELTKIIIQGNKL